MDAIETKYEPFTRQAVRGDIGSIVSWSSAVTVMISCQFDVSLFPYDEQNCVVGFESWILDRDSYVLGNVYVVCSFWSDPNSLERAENIL